ncbi:MAG: glutathione-dependent reductase [Novosphingobium pentaromativorans]|uniref:Glutathione-dependent reductase n=1 Tax=Novosphingobium pentaromativorans TaxID=205844 RepID=A0A2W5QE85_9SPHN|nr:MAG: glutathione-dependent reductase [Novosphingobium pentaromativorans]
MGMLVDGQWHDVWYDTKATGGRFIRKDSAFRDWLGPEGQFPAEAGRYHLYVSLACPWAHRTLIVRALKGLEALVSVSVVNWLMLEKGWTFDPAPGVIADPINHARYLHEVYTAADPTYSGRVTVPVLWDRKTGRIVNNESSEIIRMFNRTFDDLGARPGDFYPEPLREEIDAVNARVYDTVNNGVYKAGFATSQEAYEEAVGPLFDSLDWLEERLSRSRYLVGDTLTEADIRLFTTLVRFDAVYVGHFKCNLRRIFDYPNLQGFLRDIYQTPGLAETVNFQHIKGHYYQSHRTINPTGIVPSGPILDLDTPHGRDRGRG